MTHDAATFADEAEFTTLEVVSDRELAMRSPEIVSVPAFPHPIYHPLKTIGWLIRTAFGIASLMLVLAVIAAIPVLWAIPLTGRPFLL